MARQTLDLSEIKMSVCDEADEMLKVGFMMISRLYLKDAK